jgi:hypothetical protein
MRGDRGGVGRPYSPDLQSLLRSLLATLADLDFAYESDLEVVKNSATDELLKRAIVAKLERQHCERRAPYVRNSWLYKSASRRSPPLRK